MISDLHKTKKAPKENSCGFKQCYMVLTVTSPVLVACDVSIQQSCVINLPCSDLKERSFLNAIRCYSVKRKLTRLFIYKKINVCEPVWPVACVHIAYIFSHINYIFIPVQGADKKTFSETMASNSPRITM